MKKLLRYLNRNLGASPTEARAFVAMLAVIVIIYGASFAVRWSAAKPEITRDVALEEQLNAYFSTVEKADEDRLSVEPELFNFNPNTLGTDSLRLLGFTTEIARRIVSYREKVGGFKIKSDLQKIYNLPDSQYQKLEAYIQLPDRLAENSRKAKTEKPPFKKSTYTESSKPKAEVQSFDINKADTTVLKQVKGIGSVLSQRIVKFRDKLGGFASMEQLREVYGIAPEVAEELLKYGSIAEGYEPAKLNVNTATVEELAAHPYISRQEARLIVAYRKQHGHYSGLEKLEAIHGLSAQKLAKLAAYLTY